MKKFFIPTFIALLTLSCSRAGDGIQGLSEEVPLNYENGMLETGTVSSTGLVAPQGYVFSEIKTSSNPGMSCFYLNFNEVARFTVADDFVIPSNEIWNIEEFSFFIINPLSPNTATNFPVKNLVMEIYDADPAVGGANKVFGDMNTNLFESASPTNIYSITDGTTDITDENTVNKIYKVDAKINKNLNLKSGHYWYKMTLKFDYGEDWFCFMPRLPEKVNNQTTFNSYYQNQKTGDIFHTDSGTYNGETPVNYETNFKITGIKTRN